MASFSFLAVLFYMLVALVLAQDPSVYTYALPSAIATINNPANVGFVATFDATSTNSTIRGIVSGVSNPDGKGVNWNVDLMGFPDFKENGPFMYHIHAHTIPASQPGNCTAALGHFDPTLRGDSPVCDAANAGTCEAGDLSGKHGTIDADPFTAKYTDDFLSTNVSSPYYFGNRSLVIHSHEGTRIACANFDGFNATISNTSASASASAPTTTSAQLSATTLGANASRTGVEVASASASAGAATKEQYGQHAFAWMVLCLGLVVI